MWIPFRSPAALSCLGIGQSRFRSLAVASRLSSRLTYSTSQLHLVTQWLDHVHPRFHTPIRAIVVFSLMGALLYVAYYVFWRRRNGYSVLQRYTYWEQEQIAVFTSADEFELLEEYKEALAKQDEQKNSTGSTLLAPHPVQVP